METFIKIWPSLTWLFTFVIIALIPLVNSTTNNKTAKVLIIIQSILLAIQLICLTVFLIFNKL